MVVDENKTLSFNTSAIPKSGFNLICYCYYYCYFYYHDYYYYYYYYYRFMAIRQDNLR